MKNKFIKNLIDKETRHPRKMKIKEFEKHVQPNIESINLMVRNSMMALKRFAQDPHVSKDVLLIKLKESIVMGSLAGKIIIN
jgi:hypothetical protein